MKIIFIKIIFIIVLCIAPSVAYTQYTIPNKTREKVKINPVLSPDFRQDTTEINMNSAAYYRYKKMEKRRAQNSLILVNSLTTSQTGYKNWAAGGTNSFLISLKSILDHTYNSTDKMFSTRTTWDFRYSMITKEYQDENEEEQKKFSKNEDKLYITNNINYKLYGKFFYDFNTSLSTQFTDTYAKILDEEPVSKFFAPATLNIGLGLTYKLDDKRMVTFSPISGNMLFVRDKRLSDLGAFGVEKGKKIKSNIGVNIKVNWLQSLIKDKNTGATILSYKILAESFYDYNVTPTLTWDNNINFIVLKYLTLNFNWTLKFDSEVKPQEGSDSFWQFRDILSVGVAYTFNNKTRKIRSF